MGMNLAGRSSVRSMRSRTFERARREGFVGANCSFEITESPVSVFADDAATPCCDAPLRRLTP